ncbi:transcriptional protein SWT1 isoform X2 [Scaptodrosophila lebanonensis]|uniref:Transcriptional protein SWT1 isoform X2 n=1 Tax=Drosophila lebanonensis TaxID=7225 RepID=A0A6J2TSP8_DROLE|nr:transcriptional protein SWT1 isoform X2 [Scaptodrosophila lebanonensis]
MAHSSNEKNRKNVTKPLKTKDFDEYEKNELFYSIRQNQLPTKKQPAQDRLKRLQTHLKKADSKKVANEIPKKSSTNNRSTSSPFAIFTSQSKVTSSPILPRSKPNSLPATPIASGSKPTASPPTHSKNLIERAKSYIFSDKSKPELKHNAVAGKASYQLLNKYKADAVPKLSTGHHRLNNTWEKPKALFDAGNKLNKSDTPRTSANERLESLRQSLQQQQQKESNNNETPSMAPSDHQLQTAAPKTIDVEPMDWEDLDDSTLNEVDTSADDDGVHNAEDVALVRSTSVDESADEKEFPAHRVDHMYFVLDTNILIHDLLFVEDLLKVVLPDTVGSMLYVPYVVIKELDRLKDKNVNNVETTRLYAKRAIRYLNKKFDESLDIQAQSAIEEAQHLIDVDCPDDSIVNCCLQLQTQVTHMMLLTNDANLRLKANASSIKVSCRSDLLSAHAEAFATLDDS